MKASEFKKLIREEVRRTLKEMDGSADFDFNGFTSFLKSIGIQSKEFYDPDNYTIGQFGKRPDFDAVGGDSLLSDFKKLKSLSPEKQRQMIQYFKGPKKLDSFQREYGSVQVAIHTKRNQKTYNLWITSETHVQLGSRPNKKLGDQEFFIKWIKR